MSLSFQFLPFLAFLLCYLLLWEHRHPLLSTWLSRSFPPPEELALSAVTRAASMEVERSTIE